MSTNDDKMESAARVRCGGGATEVLKCSSPQTTGGAEPRFASTGPGGGAWATLGVRGRAARQLPGVKLEFRAVQPRLPGGAPPFSAYPAPKGDRDRPDRRRRIDAWWFDWRGEVLEDCVCGGV